MKKAQPEILIVDDGELGELSRQLTELGLEHRREQGPRPNGTLSPPAGLLITTPRRAGAVRRGSPAHAPYGRPIRVIAVEAATSSTRRLLRRTGFQLVVRLPVHDSVWRLLAGHALYAGDERREDTRVAVGSATSVQSDGGAPRVMLMDVSNRGCRLMSSSAFEAGEAVEVKIPDRDGDEAPLVMPGRVARSSRVASDDPAGGGESFVSAVVFSPSVSEAERMRLGVLINRWSVGPASLSDAAGGPSVPACESREIPGLVLDDETDPAVRVAAAVDLTPRSSGRASGGEAPSGAGGDERRSSGRGSFAVPVVARSDEARRMLIGRDLSTRGMRVEPHADVSIGDRFRLALYGVDSPEPLIVSASVIRDDGDAGLALRFDVLSKQTGSDLEKLVACLPDLDSLREGESFGLGAVIGEVLESIGEASTDDG
jgi:hypothetical protein